MAYAEKRGKGPNPWRVKFRLPDGTWDSASGFARKEDALEHGRAIETDVKRGVFIDPRDGKVTIAKLADDWLESIDVGPGSLRSYRSRLNSHIIPQWGDHELGSITGMAVRTWLKGLRKKGLSENTISGVEALLRMMLDDAVSDRLIPANPVQRKTRRGRYVSKRKKPADERLWATAEQVAAIAENAREVRGLMGYAIVLTLAYTGMRISELTAVRVVDCHLMAKKHAQWINVPSQMQYVDGEYARVPCKYDSGREVVIPPFLADILTQVIAELPAAADGEDPFERPLFRSSRGGRLVVGGGSWYQTSWRVFVAGRSALPSRRGHGAVSEVKAVPGMAGLDPHGLRHGHKVWLDEDDIPRVAVERRMGHEIQGVEGVYSHVSPEMTKRISEKLQARWERSQSGDGASAEDAVAESG